MPPRPGHDGLPVSESSTGGLGTASMTWRSPGPRSGSSAGLWWWRTGTVWPGRRPRRRAIAPARNTPQPPDTPRSPARRSSRVRRPSRAGVLSSHVVRRTPRSKSDPLIGQALGRCGLRDRLGRGGGAVGYPGLKTPSATWWGGADRRRSTARPRSAGRTARHHRRHVATPLGWPRPASPRPRRGYHRGVRQRDASGWPAVAGTSTDAPLLTRPPRLRRPPQPPRSPRARSSRTRYMSCRRR